MFGNMSAIILTQKENKKKLTQCQNKKKSIKMLKKIS